MSESAHPGASEAAPSPDVAIRARPPSPRRLSRKVLMTGAIIAAAIVTLSLFIGLSERPERGAAQADAQAAAGGPPESIRNAPGQYDAGDLPRGQVEAEDILWGEHTPSVQSALAPPQNANARGSPANASPSQQAPDPQVLARASSILFSGGGAVVGGEEDVRLDARLLPPRSRYELMAGAVIPAALVTELNSDLPGRAIAQVTANIFDSISGEHLLIPQGARLIGAYDSDASYGDRRLLLLWDRLIFPNGWSLSLRAMQGTDPTGASGMRDRTDNHFGQLAAAIGMSAIISVVADNAQDDDGDKLGQSVGDAASAEAARSGGRIVDRQLNVQPTLRVRAGGAVRVLVTRDIQLRPYRP